jgi:hypothetical protein
VYGSFPLYRQLSSGASETGSRDPEPKGASTILHQLDQKGKGIIDPADRIGAGGE